MSQVVVVVGEASAFKWFASPHHARYIPMKGLCRSLERAPLTLLALNWLNNTTKREGYRVEGKLVGDTASYRPPWVQNEFTYKLNGFFHFGCTRRFPLRLRRLRFLLLLHHTGYQYPGVVLLTAPISPKTVVLAVEILHLLGASPPPKPSRPVSPPRAIWGDGMHKMYLPHPYIATLVDTRWW